MTFIYEEKFIEGFDNRYKISNTGRVFSCVDFNGDKVSYFREIKPYSRGETPYLTVTLCHVNKIQRRIKVHRLVALHFLPKIDNKPFVNHIDGNRFNNHISNLEWCTQAENNQHAWDIGLRKFNSNTLEKTLKKSWHNAKNTKNHASLNKETINEIVQLYCTSQLKLTEIAREFQTNKHMIWRIIHGKTYYNWIDFTNLKQEIRKLPLKHKPVGISVVINDKA